MKKTGVAAAVVAVLVGGWWGAAAYTSHRFEQSYREQMAAVQKKYPFFALSDLQTQSGLTSGVYSGKITIGCSGKGGLALVIHWEDQVQYGPFPGFKGFGAAAIKTHFSVADDAPEALRKALAAIKPEDISTQVGYGGGFATRVHLPAGDFQQELPTMQAQARWGETVIEASGQLDGSRYGYHAQMPELAWSAKPAASAASAASADAADAADAVASADPAASAPVVMPSVDFKIKGVDVQADSQAVGAYVWLRQGTETASIEHMETTTTGPDGHPIGSIMEKVAVKGSLAVSQDLLDGHAQYTIGSMSFPMPGKVLTIANADVQATVKHLHAPTLDKILAQVMQTVYRQCDASPDPTAAATAMLQAFAKAAGDAKQLLIHDPEVSFDKFAMDIDGKRGEFSLAASLHGLTAADLAAGPALQAKLMQSAKLNAQGKMPLAWLNQAGAQASPEQAQLMADSMVQRGFAVREGDFLKAQFQFDKGAMTLNGKPMGAPRPPPAVPAPAPTPQ
ncbi:MAG TPA: DUF945 family protein [Burkholderiaceae bacterium]